MHSHSYILSIILHLLSSICLAHSDHLNLTTIALVNNVSVIQCWQLNQPIISMGGANSSSLGPLGDPVNATWMSAPAGTSNPDHPAKVVEYNVVLSGTLHLGVNATGQSAIIEGGAYGLLLVTDTMGKGHSATIGPHAPAVVLMLPIKDDVLTCHTVLHDGQCLDEEMNF